MSHAHSAPTSQSQPQSQNHAQNQSQGPNTNPNSFHPLVLDNGASVPGTGAWEVSRPMLDAAETPLHESIVVELFPNELQARARGLREFSSHSLTARDKIGLILILFSACKNPEMGVEAGSGSEDGAAADAARKKKRKSKPRKTNFLQEEADENDDPNDDAAVEAALDAEIDPHAIPTQAPALGFAIDNEGNVSMSQRILVYFEVVRSEMGDPLVLRYVFVSQDRNFSWDRYITNLIKSNVQRRLKAPRKFEEDTKKKWMPHLSLTSQEDWMAKYLCTVCPSLAMDVNAHGLALDGANPGSVTRVLGMVSYFDQVRRVVNQVELDKTWIPESNHRVMRQCKKVQYQLSNYAVTNLVNGRVASLKYQFPAATRADVWQYDFLSAKPEMVWVTQFPHIPADQSQLKAVSTISPVHHRSHFLRLATEASTKIGSTETSQSEDRVQVLAETNAAALKQMDDSAQKLWRSQPKNWNALLDAMTESSASMGAVARFFREERCGPATSAGHNGPLLYKHTVPCVDSTLTQFQNWILHFYAQLDDNFKLRGNHDTALYLVSTSLAPFAYNGFIIPHTVMTGAAGTGKSFLLELLKLFMIPGTFEAFTRVTNKVFETVDDQNNLGVLFDEMSRHILGTDESGRGTGGTGDPAIKSALSSSVMSLSSFFQDEAGVRRAIKIFKKFHSWLVGASNDSRDDFPSAIQSRLFIRDILQAFRAFEDNVDIDVAEMFAGLKADENADKREAFVEEMHDLMMLSILTMQAIRVKLLPEPALDVYHLSKWRFLKFLEARGIKIKEDRKLERMTTSAYILTVMQAVLDVFWCGTDREFQFSHLEKLKDHLCIDLQTTAVVLSMHFDQYVDVLEGDAVKCFVGTPYASVRSQLASLPKQQLHLFFPDADETTAAEDRHPVHAIDVSYVMVNCAGTRFTSQLESASNLMANAMNRKGFTCTPQQMVHRIQNLCRSTVGNRVVMRMDEGRSKVFVLREWLELAYRTTPWQLQQEALQTLAYPKMRRNTRLLTLCPTEFAAESRDVSALTLFHLPRVVELEDLRERVDKWRFPCDDKFRVLDCDVEEWVATNLNLPNMIPKVRWNRWASRVSTDAAQTTLRYPTACIEPLRRNHRIRCLALARSFELPAEIRLLGDVSMEKDKDKDDDEKEKEKQREKRERTRVLHEYGAIRTISIETSGVENPKAFAQIKRMELEAKRRRVFMT